QPRLPHRARAGSHRRDPVGADRPERLLSRQGAVDRDLHGGGGGGPGAARRHPVQPRLRRTAGADRGGAAAQPRRVRRRGDAVRRGDDRDPPERDAPAASPLPRRGADRPRGGAHHRAPPCRAAVRALRALGVAVGRLRSDLPRRRGAAVRFRHRRVNRGPFVMMPGMLERLLLLAATLLIPVAIRLAFVLAPTEGKMGEVQRIFYFHVPSAEMAFLGVGLSALFSVVYLYGRRRLVDVMAEAAAELGCLFCTIVLVTGPIWARPIWGVWWTGEVRLTSTLV